MLFILFFSLLFIYIQYIYIYVCVLLLLWQYCAILHSHANKAQLNLIELREIGIKSLFSL